MSTSETTTVHPVRRRGEGSNRDRVRDPAVRSRSRVLDATRLRLGDAPPADVPPRWTLTQDP